MMCIGLGLDWARMHHHTASHDPVLVALSILIAALASYTALDLATRMRAAASGRASHGWLVAAAIAMGGGIWSMHFVGMLAFSLPGVEISYDPFQTLLSLVIPIVVAAAAFAVVGRRPRALLASGFAMGLAISAMHYTGMSAMRMAAAIEYDPSWVALSIVIAIGASVVALWLAFCNTDALQRLFAGLVMGLAISGMHYAAMKGASFVPAAAIVRPGNVGVGQAPLGFLLAGTTILILIIGLAAAVYDRASAERAERESVALRRSEERFRLLVEAVADHAIFMLEQDGCVANWNLGAQRLMGYGDDIVGTNYAVFHTEEDRKAGLPEHALIQAGREGKSAGEGWLVRKDGSRFWAETSIVVVRNESGEAVGFAKIVRDVSERRQAQEALERTRDALVMSQKMDTIGQLTGGVAHDFNNLLAAVLGSLELLKKRVQMDDPKIHRLVDNAIQGALRGASLTQRMLAFARKQDLKPVVVDVRELVRGMTALLKFDAGVRIETPFPMELPKVKVDANQLELAVLNLAVNASDAMPTGGVITIAAREEQSAEEVETKRYVALSVTDSGCGMDDETLKHAQEPFFTTKGVGKGTGLGLSMVHGLAEQSGGRLVLKSRLGEGTTAEIWLPIAEEPAIAEKQESSTSIPRISRRLSVLVVDDDMLVLENTAAMLEDLGHTVVEARSGEEALSLLRRTRTVDLVVTDYAMPGMTGLQLADAVAADRPGTVILLSTGYAELPRGGRSTLPRISKPFDQLALARAIEMVMSNSEHAGSVVAFRPKSA
jgi:PAS domain S-box-containing protein